MCVLFESVDHGSCRGDTMRALDRWRHPVASSEALVVLHRVMRPVLYCCIATAIKIAIDSPAFFVAVDSLLPTNIAK